MKEYLGFIKWQWSSIELDQKIWILGFLFFIISYAFPTPVDIIMKVAGISIIFILVFKWIVWESTRESWKKYKKSKEGLFENIKNSDRR